MQTRKTDDAKSSDIQTKASTHNRVTANKLTKQPKRQPGDAQNKEDLSWHANSFVEEWAMD